MGEFSVTDRRGSGKTNKMRELVEAGGHPWIKLVIREDDVVEVSAMGVPEQNVIPILARIVKAYAQAPEAS